MAGALLAAVLGVAWVVGYQVVVGLGTGAAAHPAVMSADTVVAQEARPFQHAEHRNVTCAACHASEQDPAIVTVRTPADCASCHHDPGRGYTCGACHAADRIAGDRPVEMELALTVWDEPRLRSLPFEHNRHTTVACADCHTSPVTLAVTTGCSDCHQDHHRPDAGCTACHTPALVDAHDYEVHLTCSNAGCHSGAGGERPVLTRSLCLSCHVEQVDHEPGLSCQQCHMIPEERPARALSRIMSWLDGGVR